MKTAYLMLFFIAFALDLRGSDPVITAAISPTEVIIGSRVTWDFTFTVVEDTIQPGTILQILTFSSLKDLSFANVSTGSSNGTVITNFGTQTVRDALITSHPVWDNDRDKLVVQYKINSPVPPGEFITVRLGSPFQETKVHNTATNVEFKVLLKRPSEGYVEDIIPLEVKIKSFNSKFLKCFIPSIIKTNDIGNDSTDFLKIALVDRVQNRKLEFEGELMINCGPNSNLIDTLVQMTAANQGYLEVPLRFTEEGFCQCSVDVISANSFILVDSIPYTTNYAWVKNDPDYRIYWGDLHSHSEISNDAFGGKYTLEYAKYTSCLDFFSAAEHNQTQGNDWSAINDEEWAFMKQQVFDFHQPGKFVPILSYENNYDGYEGGHHNVYHDWDDMDSIGSIVRYPTNMAPDVNALFSLLDNYPSSIKTLCFPHFLFDSSITPEDQLNPPYESFGSLYENNKYRRLYEMFSSHGQSEYYNPNNGLDNRLTYWYAQDALAKGEKMGFIASSDNHTSKPGQKGEGVGAIISEKLDRHSIFQSMENRRTYGSVGDRIIIEFKHLEDQMGSDVMIESGAIPVFKFLVHGTGPLEKVELVKWDFLNGTYNGIHPEFVIMASYDNLPDGTLLVTDTIADDGFLTNSVYYLRVKQEEDIFNSSLATTIESWAWSSPIWISDTVLTTSLFDSRVELISLSPNPVKEGQILSVEVDAKTVYPNAQIAIFNQQGKLIKKESHPIFPRKQQFQISMGSVPCGNYFLSISEYNQRLLIEPFIILH